MNTVISSFLQTFGFTFQNAALRGWDLNILSANTAISGLVLMAVLLFFFLIGTAIIAAFAAARQKKIGGY